MRTAASSFADTVPSTAAGDQHDRVPVLSLVQELEVLAERGPRLPAVPLQHHPAFRSDEPKPGQRIQGLLRCAERIRRVGEDQVEGAGEPRQRPRHVVPQKRAALRAAELPGVALDDLRRLRVLLDQGRVGGPARERLQRQRAGPRVQIQHAQAVAALPEHVEEALPDPVRSGARGLARHRPERPPAQLAADDPHSFCASPATSSTRTGAVFAAPARAYSSIASKQQSASSFSWSAGASSRNRRWWRAAACSRVAPRSSAQRCNVSSSSRGAARSRARRNGPAATSCRAPRRASCSAATSVVVLIATGASSDANPGSGSASLSALGGAPRDLSWRTSSAASSPEPPSGTISSPSSSWQTWDATRAASRAAGVLSAVVASATPVKPTSISRRIRSASGTALPARGGSLSSARGPWKWSSSAALSADCTNAASSRASSGPTSSAEPLGRDKSSG